MRDDLKRRCFVLALTLARLHMHIKECGCKVPAARQDDRPVPWLLPQRLQAACQLLVVLLAMPRVRLQDRPPDPEMLITYVTPQADSRPLV